MKNRKILFITHSAVIAALYYALTLLSKMVGLADGAIQCRFSEMLCILPLYSPAAVPGLFVGCFLTNILIGANVWDIVFGSLATLLGVLGARALRKHKWLVALPTVISNTVIVALVIVLSTGLPFSTLPMTMLTVCIGEVISCGLFGTALILVIERYDSVKKLFSL